MYWIYGKKNIEKIYPFKIHVYGIGITDYLEITDVCYLLKQNDICYKVLNPQLCNVGYLERVPMKWENQVGKMLTIYPENKEHFIKIVHLIDGVLTPRKNLKIQGDKKLDTPSGRLFYRYELKTGEYKDYIFYVAESENDGNLYTELYEPNRGRDKYLADDMTGSDDPFIDLVWDK